MHLKSADLYYGTSRYPITNLRVSEVPHAPLTGELLKRVVQDVTVAIGCLTYDQVLARISHNAAHDEQVFDLPSGELRIPAKVALIGNGFSVIWE